MAAGDTDTLSDIQKSALASLKRPLPGDDEDNDVYVPLTKRLKDEPLEGAV